MSRESDRAVVPEKTRTPRIALAPPLQSPFVCRHDEIGQALRLLDAAVAGRPQLAVLEGPAGIGKTRLAEEVAARARERGARVAIGRCWQAADAPPLWPWRTILRELGASEGALVERPGEEAGDFGRFVAVADRLRAAEGGPLVIVIDGAERADPASLLLVQALIRESAFPLLIVLT